MPGAPPAAIGVYAARNGITSPVGLFTCWIFVVNF